MPTPEPNEISTTQDLPDSTGLHGKNGDDGGDLGELVELGTVGAGSGLPLTDEEAFGVDSPFLAEKSELKANKSDHKKQATGKVGGGAGGRPRKDGLPPGTVTREIPIPFPRPPFAIFKNDATAPNQRSKGFYNWWNQLPKWGKDRSLVYVYRTWPVLKPIPEEAKQEGNANREFAYIDKISGSEPLQDDVDLLQRYGCGSYLLRFNESPGQTIATIWVSNLGGDRLIDYPPMDRRISDPAKHLDMDHPGNKSYIEHLRMRGKLPEQQSKEKAEAEMATIEAMKEMANSNKEMLHEVIGMAKDTRRQAEPAADALKNALDVVTDGAKRSNEMLHETINRINEMRGGKGDTDAGEMMKLALELAEKLASRTPDTGMSAALLAEVQALRERVSQMQDQRIASLEQRLATASNPTITPGSQFGSIKEGINAFKEMKELVDSVSGGNKGGDEEDPASGLPGWLKGVVNVMPHVNGVVSSARDIFALWQMGGRVVGGMAGAGMGQPGQPQPQPQSQPQQFQPQSPQPQSQPQPIPAAATTTPTTAIADPNYGLPPQVAGLLSSIQIPFLNHLEGSMADGPDALNGGDFADWFIGGYGEVYFRDVCKFGEDQLMLAINMYPPIMERIQANGWPIERVRGLVREFVTYKPEDDGGSGDGSNGGGDNVTPMPGGETGGAA